MTDMIEMETKAKNKHLNLLVSAFFLGIHIVIFWFKADKPNVVYIVALSVVLSVVFSLRGIISEQDRIGNIFCLSLSLFLGYLYFFSFILIFAGGDL